ncbi:hypothetical protein F5Y06DRAFT_237524 [Hypoxylon sp. FL0890]|nr:hypothetical protein F5Y06DRAFT_237524 [Hypoxylon sp. FL0890]
MAPIKNSNSTAGATSQKPVVLGPVPKARRVLPKYSHAQRSSLRRAVQESLRDPSAVAAFNTPPSPISHPSSRLSSSVSRGNAIPQRNSLRRALRESLRNVTATPAVATPSALPSLTQTLTQTSSSDSISSIDSVSSALSTPATTPLTSITPLLSASPFPAATAARSPSTTSTSTLASSLRSSRSSVPPQYGGQHVSDSSLAGSDISEGSKDDYGRLLNESEDERRGHAAATGEVDTNGIPTTRKGWYRVRSIIAEMPNQNGRLTYLVDWEGRDPRTGLGWPSSWVDVKNVSAAAIREWMKLRDSKAAA